MVAMFEEAYKKCPTNEDLGAQTFFANVRASHWKSAHQVCFFVSTSAVTLNLLQIATRMYKQFQEERYLYWSVMCAVLQVGAKLYPIRIFSPKIIGQR
jgi:N-terminal acetyltransferase B complex non-catalytic subunit